MNQPRMRNGQAIRVRESDYRGRATTPPEDHLIGKQGVIEAYGGWFGSGSTFPIQYVNHDYIVRIDDKLYLISEDWLEVV